MTIVYVLSLISVSLLMVGAIGILFKGCIDMWRDIVNDQHL